MRRNKYGIVKPQDTIPGVYPDGRGTPVHKPKKTKPEGLYISPGIMHKDNSRTNKEDL